jgi:hypothetical protein
MFTTPIPDKSQKEIGSGGADVVQLLREGGHGNGFDGGIV